MGRLGNPRVFSIRPEAPFLPTLVSSLFEGELVPDFRLGDDVLALADIRIFVPTRRAARALRAAFLDGLGGRSVILPRITPIGDVDEDDYLTDATLADEGALPPNISDMERRTAITRLVLSWSRHVASGVLGLPDGRDVAVAAAPADAARLADDLIRLMDQVATEQADWANLLDLVPENYARYWQISLEFLKIVTEHWPGYLAERGAIDPGTRRNLAIERAATRFREAPPATPVIAAGSTGTAPATARLLDAIARMPNGAVVLPGLDVDLAGDAWNAVGAREDAHASPSHPQYGMRQLISSMGVERSDVLVLPERTEPDLSLRCRIVNEAMRPAEATDGWAAFDADTGRLDAAFASVCLIEARNEEEEALAIALCLREAIATEQSGALVTPDRVLARRVAAHLGRWNVRVDDSAGRPLASTPPAILARLVAETALGGYEPVDLLALIKHPLARFGLSAADCRSHARLTERAVLRGPRPRAGSGGLIDAVFATRDLATAGARLHASADNIVVDDWERIAAFTERIAAALKPLEELRDEEGEVSVAALVEKHAAALRAVIRDEGDAQTGGRDPAAEDRLAEFFQNLAALGEFGMRIRTRDWPALLDAWMSGIIVRPRIPGDPRISIWGPMEARLQTVDRLVLGGLVEGVWPAATRSDPWLSRPMRHDVGLEAPERRIGLSAHDFVQGLGARDVVLTLPLTADGAPSVASRWLQRLKAVLGDETTGQVTARGDAYISLARRMDGIAETAQPAPRPEPKPPLDVRPRRLSVTEIETLIRDPYEIYARHVLKLTPFDPVGGIPDMAERGTILHDICADFVASEQALNEDGALDRLLAIGAAHFQKLEPFPDIRALWWPRFERIAAKFLDWERRRRGALIRSHTEISGRIAIDAGDISLELRGRADRIDQLVGGGLAVLDYKTGAMASKAQVESLLAPQLPLEAAIAFAGGFDDIPAGIEIAEIAYVALKDSHSEAFHQLRAAGEDAAHLAGEALAQLSGLVTHYAQPENGYRSRARPVFERRYPGPYDHLARVKEWSLTAGEAE